MENNQIVDNELVDKFDAEDTIFNNCMNDFSEFPEYITGFDDIEGHFSKKHMSPAFKNLNVDSVFQKKNNDLVNIEHHSDINSNLMKRDYNYMTTLVEASKQKVYPFIFNTGKIPSKRVVFANDVMFFNPTFFNTREIRGKVTLNNLRYKIKNKEELTQHDALDLIWLIKTNIDVDREELLHHLAVDIWAKAVAPKWMLDAIRKNLILWGKKYLVNKKIIEEFKGALKMSRLEVKSFEEQMRIAGIAGELERAEERGLKEGHENGLKEIISNLLESYSPDEVSRMAKVPLDFVIEVKNGC